MKVQGLYQKLLMVIAVAIVCSLLWAEHSARRQTVGHEYPPKQLHGWLTGQLQKRFGWSALPASSIEGAWAQGFQDHLYLFRIRLAPGAFADLRRAVATAPGKGFDDRDDLSLSLYGLATASPRVKSLRLPAWWDPASLQHFDSLRWHSGSDPYGFWFCYSADRQVLFILISNTWPPGT
jgi:hypothetical protein